MPSLKPSVGSTSALLRTAGSLASSLAANQDEAMRIAFQNNPSDAGLTDYLGYLNTRITHLNSTGSISDNTKAMSMAQTMTTATHTNISYDIANENIQVLAGNATLQDKYNTVVAQYARAVPTGDMPLLQSLETQAYSLNQQIQYQQQTSAAASSTLAKASGTSQAKGEESVATTISADLAKFNTAYAHAGTANAKKVLGDFVTAHKDQFAALGVILKPGVAPNYFDVVSGANQAIFAAHNAAGDAVAPYADDGGQSYYDKAAAVVSNIPTIYGKMNANQLQNAADHPYQFATKLDPDLAGSQSGPGGSQNPQVGYKYDPKQGVVPVVAASPWVNIPNNLNYRLNELGLNVVGNIPKAGQGQNAAIEVTSSKNTPAWLLKAIPSNATTHLFVQPNGDIQFESQGKSGVGIFTATTNNQLYERDGTDGSYKLLGSGPGGANGVSKGTADFNMALFGFSLTSGNATVNNLITEAQTRAAAVTAANAAFAKTMLAIAPPPLPTISIAPPHVTTPSTPNVTVQKPTYTVAPTTTNPQNASTVGLQGTGATKATGISVNNAPNTGGIKV